MTNSLTIDDPGAWLGACCDPANILSVALFGRTRVARGWRLVERRIPEHYCFLILDRGGEVAVDGQRLRLQPGSCVWIAPNIPHTVLPLSPQHPFRFFHWRFRLIRDGRDLTVAPAAVLRSDGGHLQPLFEAAWAEWLADLPAREPRLRCLLAAITGDLLRGPGAGPSRLGERQRRAVIDHIHDRLPASIHPAELAARLGLSHDYATRIISDAFGCPPRQLILRERVRAAAEDLSSSEQAVARIALRWGFPDQRYFARQFRRVMGCSPRVYRQRQSRTS